MSSRIPPLLEPALSVAAHPSSSLSLVTSVLGASANWLLLRYLYDVLVRRSALTGGVVFVSFLRDRLFWRDGAARLVRTFDPRLWKVWYGRGGNDLVTTTPRPSSSLSVSLPLPALLCVFFLSFAGGVEEGST